MQDTLSKAYHEDGAVLIKGLLNPEQLSRCREAYDWPVLNHGPHATRKFAGPIQQAHVHNPNP